MSAQFLKSLWSVFGPLVLSAAVLSANASSALALDEPDWPQECVKQRQDVPAMVDARLFEVRIDGEQAGWQIFCVESAGSEVSVYQWASTHVDNFFGVTAVKHCRKERWKDTKAESSDPRSAMQLMDIRAWTNFDASGAHRRPSSCDSSITISRQPDGSYLYVVDALFISQTANPKITNPCDVSRSDDEPIVQAAPRSPWTEAMIAHDSFKLLDPVRYRDLSAEVTASGPGFLNGRPARTYRIESDSFEYDMTFDSQSGALLKMDGEEFIIRGLIGTSVEISSTDRLELKRSGNAAEAYWMSAESEQRTCPDPLALRYVK